MATMRITKYEFDHKILPEVCALTGKPTTYMHALRFVWFPSRLAVFLIFGLVGYAIAVMICKREMWVTIPIVRRKRWHWAWKKAFALGGMMACMIAIIVGSTNSNHLTGFREVPDYGLIASRLGLVGIVIMSGISWWIEKTGIRALEITGHDIELTGLHENFVQAMGIERFGEEARELVRQAAFDRWEAEQDTATPTGWGSGNPRARRVREEDESQPDSAEPTAPI